MTTIDSKINPLGLSDAQRREQSRKNGKAVNPFANAAAQSALASPSAVATQLTDRKVTVADSAQLPVNPLNPVQMKIFDGREEGSVSVDSTQVDGFSPIGQDIQKLSRKVGEKLDALEQLLARVPGESKDRELFEVLSQKWLEESGKNSPNKKATLETLDASVDLLIKGVEDKINTPELRTLYEKLDVVLHSDIPKTLTLDLTVVKAEGFRAGVRGLFRNSEARKEEVKNALTDRVNKLINLEPGDALTQLEAKVLEIQKSVLLFKI